MSYKECIAVSDLSIQMDVLFESTIWSMNEYKIPDPNSVDLRITITQEDIKKEKELEKVMEERGSSKLFPDSATDDCYEMLSVLRKISEELPAYDGVTFHGSVVAVDDEAYLFAAKSGTGKSTHVALWKKLLFEKAIVVNGDKPFLRLIDDTVYAYGSPWCGKEGLQTNCRKPLKAICFLEQDIENSITEMNLDEISGLLLSQCYRPDDQKKLLKTIQLLDRMSRHLRFYKMKCNMDISAAEMSYNYMKKRL